MQAECQYNSAKGRCSDLKKERQNLSTELETLKEARKTIINEKRRRSKDRRLEMERRQRQGEE